MNSNSTVGCCFTILKTVKLQNELCLNGSRSGEHLPLEIRGNSLESSAIPLKPVEKHGAVVTFKRIRENGSEPKDMLSIFIFADN